MSIETRNPIRRRRLGLAMGAILAFALGGWTGLIAALFVVAVLRALQIHQGRRS